MKGLDPIDRGNQVAPRVYSDYTNARLVRRLRKGRSYGGSLTVDVAGCDMRCSYCYVAGSLLDGQNGTENIFGRERAAGTLTTFTPAKLAEHCVEWMKSHRWRRNIQITAGEPFMTPEWTLDTIRHLAPYMRSIGKKIWIDTNGLRLVMERVYIHELIEFRDVVRLFISSKNSPRLYTATTRVSEKYADTGFQCLEHCWEERIVAYLQAPIAAIFQPEDFQWYWDRLYRIQPIAPLLLDLDRLSLLPFKRIIGGLKKAGLWKLRQHQPTIEAKWREFLEEKYGRKLKRLISVDYHPKDEDLVGMHVFTSTPLASCPLFK